MKIRFKKILVKILKYNNSPHEIALGVAIGVFITTLPLYGLHTVLAVIAMFIVRRANKIAILVGTNFSIPPTIPFITWAGYELGRFILRGRFDPLTWADFKNLNLQYILKIYQPLFVGSLVLGLFCALVFYFITKSLIRKIKEKRELARRIKRENKKV